MNSTLFRDFVMLMALGFVAMVVWMVPFLNPPAQESEADPPGNVIVHIVWPAGDNDVDLWVWGPGEPQAVGYSNKGGFLWNLLRDDLGDRADATKFNYENSYTRGIVPGEYVVNVHCYRCSILPQRVEVEVSIGTGEPGKVGLHPILTTSVDLVREGQERTAARFVLDGDGNLDPDSVNSVFTPLRSNPNPGRTQ